MGLLIRIKIPEGTAVLTLEARAVAPEARRFETTASVSGDVDEGAELAGIALGLEPRGVMKKYVQWIKSPTAFLAGKRNFKGFVKALGRHGHEPLGLSLEQLQYLLAHTIRDIVDGEADPEGDDVFEPGTVSYFMQLLDTYYPRHSSTKYTEGKFSTDWPPDAIREVMNSAVYHQDEDAYDAMDNLVNKGELLEVVPGNLEFERPYIPPYSPRLAFGFSVRALVLGRPYEEWWYAGTATFADELLGDWEITEDRHSDNPPEEVEQFFDDVGVAYDFHDIVSRLEGLEPPWVPQFTYDGNFAIFRDEGFVGFFDSFEDANAFLSMSKQIIRRKYLYKKSHLAPEIGVYKRSGAPVAGDWANIDNWTRVR
jgi:hypothetical protein